jgi:hypothetical protein
MSVVSRRVSPVIALIFIGAQSSPTTTPVRPAGIAAACAGVGRDDHRPDEHFRWPLNPAVTVGPLVGKRIHAVVRGAYVVVQLIGGIVGALVRPALPAGIVKVTTLGAPSPAPGMSGRAVGMEAVLTFSW